MARRMGSPRFAREGQCPSCGTVFQPTTKVIRTRGGSVCCATHAHVFVADAIVETGPWATVRRST